jgi:hypothetical protein
MKASGIYELKHSKTLLVSPEVLWVGRIAQVTKKLRHAKLQPCEMCAALYSYGRTPGILMSQPAWRSLPSEWVGSLNNIQDILASCSKLLACTVAQARHLVVSIEASRMPVHDLSMLYML